MIGILHVLFMSLQTIYILLKGSPKYYDIFVFLFASIYMSRIFFDNECLFSYVHKKSEDCSYTLGQDPTYTPDVPENSILPAVVIPMLATLYMVLKLGYDPNIFVLFITSAFITKVVAVKVEKFPIFFNLITFILGAYLLKDNQYLFGGVLLMAVLSYIVKTLDKKPCTKKT
jgi:hypothetical protein